MTSGRHFDIQVVDELPTADRDAIVDGLLEHNTAHGFTWATRPMAIVARDGTGTLVGGLLGQTNLGWLFVAALWVDVASRHRGLGGAILDAAEHEARRRGCIGVYLDTYSFQARPFYEKRGYRVFGELPDCPPGATKYYLSKALSRSAARDA